MENKSEKYLQAQERVYKIKSFYNHLIVYLLVNTFLTFMRLYHNGFESIHFNMFSTWFFWGIGLAFHAVGVFGKRLVFSENWEKRKIQEFIEEEENEVKF